VSFLGYSISKNVMTLKSGSEVTQSLKVVSFDRPCTVSYYCSLLRLSLKCTIFETFDFKNAVTLKTGYPSRSFEISPFNRAHTTVTTSYWRSIVTMALSRVVSEILNVKKCCDLKIGVRGHSRSLKVIPFDRLCILLVFFSNFVPKMHRFWDIWLVSIPWPWKPD